MGGEIVDDPDTPRVEEAMLRYPGWEAEYRLRLIAEFDQPLKVLLFATRPAHKGLHEPGSEVVAELIKTYNPKVAIVAGEGASEERLGTSLVVCPGRLDLGVYSVIDIHDRLGRGRRAGRCHRRADGLTGRKEQLCRKPFKNDERETRPRGRSR